jgi:hypothetical protein
MNDVPDVEINPIATPKLESAERAAAATPNSAQSPSNHSCE